MFLIILQGLAWTIAITIVSFSFGAVLGIFIVAGRLSRFAFIRAISRIAIELIRNVPPLVWLFIVYLVLQNLAQN